MTQKQVVFYRLYKHFLKQRGQYIPAWAFVGDVLITETREHEFMSYKAPARLTDIYYENEGLLDRDKVLIKNGWYYQYRMRRARPTDKSLLEIKKMVDEKQNSIRRAVR